MTLIDNAAGLGLRRGLLPQLLAMAPGAVDFLECAPDNWIGVGGAFGADLERLLERFPLTCHGLSLSLGGSTPLDAAFIEQTRLSRPPPGRVVQRAPQLLFRRWPSL